MNDAVRQIADAVLYEGYLLYPYRASSLKNRKRWTFGSLYSRARAAQTGEAFEFVSQFLLECSEAPQVKVTVRFLDSTEPRQTAPGRFRFGTLKGSAELSIHRIADKLYRATLRVANTSPEDDGSNVLGAAHAICEIANGNFVSLTDPPDELRAAASQCENRGVWPVLAGDPGSRNCMLISPIILYDYPRIAAESVGDLFDATEIDEILNLRILALSDDEKAEIRAGDGRARDVLDRSESLTRQDWLRLHGARRDPQPAWQRGDRVRLRPCKRADIFDIALAGQIARIDSIEIDFEGRTHLAVLIEDDPGKDLGEMRQPGHRFFFSPEEVEAIHE